MSELAVDTSSVEPPFEQVRRQIAAGAADRSLPPGHKLPTVRQLAADLGLATNTVARAYRELETDGVIETHGRKGTFIASSKLGDEVAQKAATTYVHAARTQGLSKDEAIRLVEKNWTV
ncbi:MAG: GntR family transcriptional regulator [Actinomycetota bacterium]|nr:GntR family transcriptional regulator [Actinomycetota bacterium]